MNSKGQIFVKLRTTVLEECEFLFVSALPGHSVVLTNNLFNISFPLKKKKKVETNSS